MSIEKHRLASMLRVPMRDLRMLEPNFSNSYSAAILCRERCIVLHLEQVRLLITAEEVRFFWFFWFFWLFWLSYVHGQLD